MGNIQSELSPEELANLRHASDLSETDLRRLHRRFQKIDVDGSGTLTRDEFMNIPEMSGNPLLDRVIDVFDKNHDGEIEFSEFIHSLAIFTRKDDPESKMKFAFSIYDINQDGFISNGELYTVLKKMVGSNLTDVQLQQIVDKTMIQADQDGDGKIGYEEFCRMLANTDALAEKMTLSLPEIQPKPVETKPKPMDVSKD